MTWAVGTAPQEEGPVKFGVLALQGAFSAHVEVLRRIGVDTLLVRSSEELDRVDALVLPGGESTTMSNLLARHDLGDRLRERLRNGLPAFGTCAGMILLASTIVDGRADQIALEILDITVRRNGYGRQVDSFETDIAVKGLDDPFHAVFIRAPIVERTGNGVEVMALDPQGNPALVRQGRILATSFHPELTADDRIHRMFVESVLATAERSL